MRPTTLPCILPYEIRAVPRWASIFLAPGGPSVSLGPMQGLLADPWIRSQIDAAVAPYVGRLPAEEIAWMREQLAETLASEPQAADLLRRARPRAAVEQSGEVTVKPFSEEAAREERVRRDRTG